MSSTTTIDYDSSIADKTLSGDSLQYRAINSGALVGALLGLMSITLMFFKDHLSICMVLTPIPLIGMFISLRSWLKIRRNRDLYTGIPIAIVGFALSVVLLVAGVGQASYIYATEVPEGYQRISFLTLKPDQTETRANKPIPDDVVSLVGEQIFIKGYIRPIELTSRKNLDSFLLVRDNRECCFGDASKVKYFDQIRVVLTGKLRTDYDEKLFRVGGRLAINPNALTSGGTQPVYYLEADHVQ